MAESTLSISRNEAERYISRQLGWNPDRTTWDATMQTDMDLIVASGLRMFYNPTVLPGETHNHTWSFLKPELRISTKSGQADYDLPDDFGGIEGSLTFHPDNAAYYDLRNVSEHRIRSLRNSAGQVSGTPEIYAVMPQPANGDEPQRFVMMLYPEPGAEYELIGTYNSNPNMITGDLPYPLGGQPHAETLLAAMQAAAEEFYDDVVEGPKKMKFLERLRASVSYDQRTSGPHHFGYNGNSLRREYIGYTRATYTDSAGVKWPH